MRRPWLPWAALAAVVAVSLLIGTHQPGHESAQQKADAISAQVRCPTCEGQSALLSDAPAAQAVRQFVLAQVQAGQSGPQIEQELEDRYSSDILLVPPASGLAGLVWVLPVVAVIVAAGCLALAFRRWRGMTDAPVSDADRARVATALAHPGAASAAEPDGDGR
jgi:cytochrome c-type biogenesis protein CcmH/NrfF